MAAAGGADWIGVRVGLRGADLLLSRGGATEVLCRQGAKAGAACWRAPEASRRPYAGRAPRVSDTRWRGSGAPLRVACRWGTAGDAWASAATGARYTPSLACHKEREVRQGA